MVDNINTEVLPTAFIDKIELYSVEQNDIVQNTRVQVRVALKSPRDIASFKFLNRDLDDFLKISIVQVLDENLSAFISLSKELVYYVVNINDIPESLPLVILQLAYNRGLLSASPTTANSTQMTSELKAVFQNKSLIEVKELYDLPVLRSVKKNETLESGEQVLSTFFNVNFKIEMNADHLSYFVYSDYDSEKMVEFFGTNFNSAQDIKISSDVVINQSKIISQSYVYYLTNGSVWSGYVHYDDSVKIWRTGKLEDPEELKYPLTRRIFYNTKIQDFRIFNKIKKQEFEFQKMNEELLLKLSKFYYQPKKADPIEFEDKLYNGVIFTINLDMLLKKHSKLYNFLSEIQLNRADWIYDIRTFRKRVKMIEGEIGKSDTVVEFRKNQIESPVVNERRFLENGILTMWIEDPEIDTLYLGEYCYGARVYFVDPLISIFENQLNELIRMDRYGYLKGYYAQSIVVPSRVSSGNYDPLLNKFTNNFITIFDSAVQKEKRANTITAFIEAYNKISTAKITTESDIVVRIMEQISPTTGSPDGILNFLKLYETIINIYQKAVESSKTSPMYIEEKLFTKEKHVVTATRIPEPERIMKPALSEEQNTIIKNLLEMSDKYSITINKVQKKKLPAKKDIAVVDSNDNRKAIIDLQDKKDRENSEENTVISMPVNIAGRFDSFLQNTLNMIDEEVSYLPVRTKSKRKGRLFKFWKLLRKQREESQRNKITEVKEEQEIIKQQTLRNMVTKRQQREPIREEPVYASIFKKEVTKIKNEEQVEVQRKKRQKIQDIEEGIRETVPFMQNNQVSATNILELNDAAVKLKLEKNKNEKLNKYVFQKPSKKKTRSVD